VVKRSSYHPEVVPMCALYTVHSCNWWKALKRHDFPTTSPKSIPLRQEWLYLYRVTVSLIDTLCPWLTLDSNGCHWMTAVSAVKRSSHHIVRAFDTSVHIGREAVRCIVARLLRRITDHDSCHWMAALWTAKRSSHHIASYSNVRYTETDCCNCLSGCVLVRPCLHKTSPVYQ
jgi:hypothetical protein